MSEFGKKNDLSPTIDFDLIDDLDVDLKKPKKSVPFQGVDSINVEELIAGNLRATIDYGQYAQYYTHFLAIMPEVLSNAGDLNPKNNGNVFFIVLNKKPDATLPTELGLTDYIIVTTRRTDSRNKILINSIRSTLMTTHSIAQVTIVYSEITDLISIIESCKENYKAEEHQSDVNSEQKTEALSALGEIVSEAIMLNAADIHFISRHSTVELAFTIDSEMRLIKSLNKSYSSKLIVAALYNHSPEYGKIGHESEMTDARIKFNVVVRDNDDEFAREKTEAVTLRVSKTPSDHGPHTVMRIIRTGASTTSATAKKLGNLGLDTDIKDVLEKMIAQPSGIVLLTGPTAAGKSTTLAALYETIPPTKKIILLEDPIEYKVNHPFCVQSAINPDKEEQGYMEFLKGALRQAPNVIGISEMRSPEVAEKVISAALTGHMMVSTIHSNTSIETLSRLNDLGISWETLGLKGLFQAIAAQRLVPMLCPKCRTKDKEPVEGFNNTWSASLTGCNHCDGRGYSGRMLISEVLVIDEAVRELLVGPNNLAEIEKHVRSNGWRSMADRARMRVEQGVIDVAKGREFVPYFYASEDSYRYGGIVLDDSLVSPAVILGGVRG